MEIRFDLSKWEVLGEGGWARELEEEEAEVVAAMIGEGEDLTKKMSVFWKEENLGLVVPCRNWFRLILYEYVDTNIYDTYMLGDQAKL